jgi:cell migration-inducing and hyaluronan-binding protein
MVAFKRKKMTRKIKILFLIGVLSSMVLVLFQNLTLPTKFEIKIPPYLNGKITKKLSKVLEAQGGVGNGDGTENLVIHNGEIVVIDQDFNIGNLTIETGGEIHCPANLEKIILKAKSIMVHGRFQCGNSGDKYSSKSFYPGRLYLSLKHDSEVTMPAIDDFESGNINVPMSYRSFMVMSEGVVDFVGKPKLSWTRIVDTIQVGDSFLKVEGSINWEVGDQIVVASSNYDFTEQEVARIGAITLISEMSGSSRRWKLDLKNIDDENPYLFKYRHWGKIQNIQGVELNQRSEVANLSRNIVVLSDNEQVNTYQNKIGAHFMIMMGGKAKIDGVEFYQMGQMGILARYPFHWHRLGDASGQFLKNSSIHQSYQRCVTIHGTNNTLVENNVCYFHFGHGYFLEDGNETNNTLIGNLGLTSLRPLTHRNLLQSDINTNQAQRFPGPSTFWISNPANKIIGNVAAGSEGSGIWNAFHAKLLCGPNGCTDKCNEAGSPACNLYPQLTDTLVFNNNRAHSSRVGITWDGAPNANLSAENPRNPADRITDRLQYHPKSTPIFNGLMVYKNILTGIYFRGQTAVFKNNILADNGWALFFAYNQVVKDSVIIGWSENHSESDLRFLYDGGRYDRKQAGIVQYDGPFDLNNVAFLNYPSEPVFHTMKRRSGSFDITPVPIDSIGGARKYSNRTSGLKFRPEPFRRIYFSTIEKGASPGWVDVNNSTSITDADGSLTGSIGATIVADDPFISDPVNCQRYDNMLAQICRVPYRLGRFFFFADTINQIPFIGVRKASSGYFYSTLNIFDTPEVFNNKIGIPLHVTDRFVVLFRPEDRIAGKLNKLGVDFNSDRLNEVSPMLRLTGLGSNCKLSGAQAVSSLTALNSVSDTSYFSDARNFFIRIKTKGYFNLYTQEARDQLGTDLAPTKVIQTQGGLGQISCANSIPTVMGNVDSRDALVTRVSGWACEFGRSESINIHIYFGGLAGMTGTKVVGQLANNLSEVPVAMECGTAAKAYRFSYQIPDEIRRVYANKEVNVYGISKTGGKNNLLASPIKIKVKPL